MKTLHIVYIWYFATFNMYSVPAKILYLQRYWTDFRKLRHQLEDVEGGHLRWKVSGTQVFYVCNGELGNFAHREHFKFCHFQHVHCASKNPISPKVFNRFSKIFGSARRCWGWAYRVEKFQVRRCFTFAIAKVKTLRIDNIWNFSTFNTYTLPAKILYLRRYSTDF